MSSKEKVASKLKKGDLVEVIAGRDKGKRGKIVEMIRHENRAVVEGIQVVKRHARPTQGNPQGGIISKPASIHLSNVMIVDPNTDRPTRIGTTLVETGGQTKLVRVSKLSGEALHLQETRHVQEM
jgi:large subunit ribosomal protein L24